MSMRKKYNYNYVFSDSYLRNKITGQVLKIILNNFFVNSGAISARPLFKKNIHLRNAKMANKIQVYFHKAGGGVMGIPHAPKCFKQMVAF